MHRKSLAFFVSNASTKIVFAADASVADGLEQYRGGNKGLFVLVSRTQAGPGRAVKQEQEEISRNHVQTFISPSVLKSKDEPMMGWELGRRVALAVVGLAAMPHGTLCAHCGDTLHTSLSSLSVALKRRRQQ